MTRKRRRMIVLMVMAAMLALLGCETLKSSRPIVTQKDYELLLMGRYDADYVGTNTCLAACHEHDKIRKAFEGSTMGAQMSRTSGLPVVDCESCHGPGSLAIEGLTPEKVAEDLKAGKKTECDYKTLIEINTLPAQARSLLCIKCHTANATLNLHAWNAGDHAQSDVACSDCHSIHAGADLIVRPRETYDMCTKCHEDVRAEFSLPSHHPVIERKVFCTDCHNPHGSYSDNLLRGDTVKAACTRCHAEKEGPFVFEHADLSEDCSGCHRPHGSVNNNLLKSSMPFLCLQCHAGHTASSSSSGEFKAALYTRCTDCHSQIHGTDVPSASGKGRFTR